MRDAHISRTLHGLSSGTCLNSTGPGFLDYSVDRVAQTHSLPDPTLANITESKGVLNALRSLSELHRASIHSFEQRSVETRWQAESSNESQPFKCLGHALCAAEKNIIVEVISFCEVVTTILFIDSLQKPSSKTLDRPNVCPQLETNFSESRSSFSCQGRQTLNHCQGDE